MIFGKRQKDTCVNGRGKNVMFDIPYTEAAAQMFCTIFEIALRHGCSPVNLLRILRTPFLKRTTGQLLLFTIFDSVWSSDSYDKWQERKDRVQLYLLLQVSGSASICALYCTKHVLLQLTYKKKMINLVLVIKYYFDVRFQFDMVFKNAFFKVFTEVFLNNGSCNNMI